MAKFIPQNGLRNWTNVTPLDPSMIQWVFTARIRRMTEGNVFTLSTIWGGGGVPHLRSGCKGVPHPRSGWGGTPHPRSGQGGTPSQVWIGNTHPTNGEYPYPRSGQGVAHPKSGRGVPHPADIGVPPQDQDWGVPWGTLCPRLDGVPIA